MLKRNKLKGKGTTGDSTLSTLLPFYLKLFSVLLFQMYLSLPLNRVTLHLHLFLCTLWWVKESNEMVIIRAKGLNFLIFESWECHINEVFSGLPGSVVISGGDCVK
jgi:hypothetical protein